MIVTERLWLRNWQDSDRELFYKLCSDERVMEFMPKLLTRSECNRFVDKITQLITREGFGLWAIERKFDGRFIGYTGLHAPNWESHFTPCIEVGWRLDFDSWGQGYATEAALAAVQFGFNDLNLEEIVSFTVPANQRSRRVMTRIGMIQDISGDFEHPRLPKGHRLSHHVLYRLRAYPKT